MKVVSSKPKRQRIFKSQTIHSQYKDGSKRRIFKRPFWIEPVDFGWWFDLELGDWVQGYNGKGGMTTSYYAMTYDGFNDAYSLKAVKRLVAKWNVPKGTKFRASLPFKGHYFFIRKS